MLGALGGLAALGLLYGWLALSAGAVFPSRAAAVGIPAGLAAGGYLVNGLHGLAGWLDPFRFLSPFWLVGSSPLRSGVHGPGTAVVLGAASVALIIGSVLVEHRDLQAP